MVERRQATRTVHGRARNAPRPGTERTRWSSLLGGSRPRGESTPPTVGELEAALDEGELDVHYQLVVTADGTPAGAEALLRWRRPGHGLVAAAEFADLIVSTEILRHTVDLVLSELVAALAVIRSRLTVPRPYLGFNVTARQLEDPMLPSRLLTFLHAEQASGDGLVAELTNPAGVSDWTAVRTAVAELARLGVGVAVEDSGVDDGDLLYRDNGLIPIVKLGRTIVAESHRWQHERDVIAATVALCKAQGTTVVAQGVEHPQTMDWLAGLGVDYLQGVHIAPPGPLSELLGLLH